MQDTLQHPYSPFKRMNPSIGIHRQHRCTGQQSTALSLGLTGTDENVHRAPPNTVVLRQVELITA